jgi:Fe2+ transport system protein B
MATSIRISRDKLKAALGAKIETLKAAYEKQLKEYAAAQAKHKAALEKYRAEVVSAARKALAELAREHDADKFGDLLYLSYNVGPCLKLGDEDELKVPLMTTAKPTLEIEHIESMRKRLDLCPDEVMTLKENDDYLRYL